MAIGSFHHSLRILQNPGDGSSLELPSSSPYHRYFTRKVYRRDFYTVWYESRGPTRIATPPPIPIDDADTTVHLGDLFLHQIAGTEDIQVWLCTPSPHGGQEWIPTFHGDVHNLLPGEEFALCISKSGRPNWVKPATIYKTRQSHVVDDFRIH